MSWNATGQTGLQWYNFCRSILHAFNAIQFKSPVGTNIFCVCILIRVFRIEKSRTELTFYLQIYFICWLSFQFWQVPTWSNKCQHYLTSANTVWQVPTWSDKCWHEPTSAGMVQQVHTWSNKCQHGPTSANMFWQVSTRPKKCQQVRTWSNKCLHGPTSADMDT